MKPRGEINLGNKEKKLTKEELLFVHLLNNKYNRENYAASYLITEQGIQSMLGCDLGYISRLLKKNEKKGYIRRKKVKIENKFRIQNGFFLTLRGEKVALKINKFANHNK